MLIYFVQNRYTQTNIMIPVKPPVGVPGKDIMYIPNYCSNCNRHFLIDEEFENHKTTC